MDNNNFFFTLKSDSIAVLLLTIHLRLELGISSNDYWFNFRKTQKINEKTDVGAGEDDGTQTPNGCQKGFTIRFFTG